MKAKYSPIGTWTRVIPSKKEREQKDGKEGPPPSKGN